MDDSDRDQPEISVVVPTYNRAGNLAALLASLEAQTIGPARFELIIVDDGSQDETAPTLAQLASHSPLRLRTIRTPNHGAASARNTGWRSAAADVVAFLDDDCVAAPGWLAAGLAMMDWDERVGVVQGRTVIPEGAALGAWTVTRQVPWASPFFESHNIFYRRAALEQSRGFDEQLRLYGEDTALGWEVMARGWERAFSDDAVVVHEQAERGLLWHIRYRFVSERNLIGVAARFPDFRRAGFWRPWAFERHHVHYAAAVAGLALSRWRRPLLVLVVPYVWTRRPPRGYHPYLRLLFERLLVDTGAFAGRKAGALRDRRVVL